MKLFAPFRRCVTLTTASALMLSVALYVWPARADDAPPVTLLMPTSTVDSATNTDDADAAWKAVKRATQAPMTPEEWQTNNPSQEVQAKFFLPFAYNAADLAKDFYTRFPQNTHASEAHKIEISMLTMASHQFGDASQSNRLATLQSARLNDPTASEDEKLQMRLNAIQELLKGMPDNMDDVLKATRAVQKDFPKRPEAYQVSLLIMSRSPADKAEALAKEILASDAPDKVKEEASVQLRMIPLQKMMASLPGTMDDIVKGARDLQKDYPNRPDGYQMMLQVLSRTDGPKTDALAKEILDGPMPDAMKETVKIQQRLGTIRKLIAGLPGTTNELEQAARAFKQDFPGHPEVFYEAMLTVLKNNTGDKKAALTKELTEDPTPEQFKQMVKGELKKMDALGKPLDIQFTSFDGRPVDLSQMKGKVVLVDFWATWCGPCMGELPHVKAAYEKLHDKGFEIVGISFDEDKDALKKTLRTKEMTWPQYFDGEGWKNKYGQEFGITGIPTMWLVDKKGNLRDLEARGDLEEKVTKLLNE